MSMMMAMRVFNALAQIADRRYATLPGFAANMFELDGRVVNLKTAAEQGIEIGEDARAL